LRPGGRSGTVEVGCTVHVGEQVDDEDGLELVHEPAV
jgi:hypothetical protein